uniref:Candidate secreted effector n=1 Tax=Meloidogyne incognita TaxID=6306 RepID=A0A914KJX3_MELIC
MLQVSIIRYFVFENSKSWLTKVDSKSVICKRKKLFPSEGSTEKLNYNLIKCSAT